MPRSVRSLSPAGRGLFSRPAITLGVCAVAILAACDVTIKDGDVSFRQLHGRATREWSRTYSVERRVRVEVINGNGDIVVMAGPSGQVAATATIAARALTDQRARRLLDATQIEESATREHIRFTTVRSNQGGGLQVQYKITVPADTRVEMTANNGTVKADGVSGHVKAIVVNGGVELTGAKGSVDAASVNGSITAKMAEVTGRVRLECTNCRIALEVPRNTKATLNARSVNGGITVTGLDTPEVSGRRIRNLESSLNGGGPEIDVRVTNGRITIEGK